MTNINRPIWYVFRDWIEDTDGGYGIARWAYSVASTDARFFPDFVSAQQMTEVGVDGIAAGPFTLRSNAEEALYRLEESERDSHV